jgi:hypothetical protein
LEFGRNAGLIPASGTSWSLFPIDDAYDSLHGGWDAISNLTMHIETADDTDADSHIEKIRSNYDTTDMGAIMGRFYQAVSWGGER